MTTQTSAIHTMRLVTLCEKISSHRFMATRHLWLYDGNKMGNTSSFSHGIAWTKSYPPTLDTQKAWVNMWNTVFKHTPGSAGLQPWGKGNKQTNEALRLPRLSAQSHIPDYRGGRGFQAGHKCFPELKRQMTGDQEVWSSWKLQHKLLEGREKKRAPKICRESTSLC